MSLKIEFDTSALTGIEVAALIALLSTPGLTKAANLVPGGTSGDPSGAASASGVTATHALTNAASATSNGSEGPPSPPPPGVDHSRDADGVEWNAELHSSSKEKNGDGRWKKRRGAAKAAAGTNEPPAPPNQPPEPPAGSNEPPAPPSTNTEGPASPPNPSQPHAGGTTQTPASPAAPAPASGTPALNSDELKAYVTSVIGKVAVLMEANKMTKADANNLAVQCDFGSLAKLMTATERSQVAKFELLLPE